MTAVKSEFLNIMIERGFLHQCTDLDALDRALLDGAVTAYNGYDCTARSLHAGSLVPMMLQRWFQKCGHRTIVLMGGATTRIGDPSFKDESRPLLSADEIAENIKGIQGVFRKLLRFDDPATDGSKNAVMVNNDDWLYPLRWLDVLREVGPHFTVSRMLSFDSVKLRLEREQSLTLLEFNYMVLQAYDFLELNRVYGCTLQTGGSDQWGNIVAGVELCRRSRGATVFGLTTPLLTTSSGQKMGKTVGGAVWLNAEMLSAYDFWQYWRNTEDGDVERFLKLFTELPLPEISRLAALRDEEINEAKKVLASEVTALIHGRAAADQAAETARRTFELGQGADGLPTIEISRDELSGGIAAFALFRQAELSSSGGEARKLIRGGGARVNDKVIDKEDQPINLSDANAEGVIKLSAGKKRHVLIKVR